MIRTWLPACTQAEPPLGNIGAVYEKIMNLFTGTGQRVTETRGINAMDHSG